MGELTGGRTRIQPGLNGSPGFQTVKFIQFGAERKW